MPRGGKPINVPKFISPEVLKSNTELVHEMHRKKLESWDREKPLARPQDYLACSISAVNKLTAPLRTASTSEIRTALLALNMRPNTRHWVVMRINELLGYLGKDVMPNKRPKRPAEVPYVPLSTFERLVSKMEPDIGMYLGALYATGCRLGELPATRLDDPWVFVPKQLTKEETIGDTKNGVQRHAAILPPLKSFILAYKALPQKKQDHIRLRRYSTLYSTSKRLLGVCIHDIRHSYAIECAKRGKSAEEIASWIGDTVQVTKKHYLGYLKPTKEPWKED